MLEVGLIDVFLAANRISPFIKRTPLEEWEEISKLTGARVFFKLENLQRTDAFKFRGALNKVILLDRAEKERGIICVSSGNHAKAVALVANLFGLSAVVFVPKGTASTKIEGMRGYGAEVEIIGNNYDETAIHAQEAAVQTGRTWVPGFDDPHVVAGQGTVGLEILEDLPDVDVVVVPAGGGGLLGGIATVCRGISPGVRVIGVQSEASPPWYYSFKAGRVVCVPIYPSVAEGLAGEITELSFAHVSGLVEEFVLVSEEEIWKAMYHALNRHHMLIEGSAAVSLAAIMAGRIDVAGKRVVVVLSGGNVDPDRVSEVLKRGKCG